MKKIGIGVLVVIVIGGVVWFSRNLTAKERGVGSLKDASLVSQEAEPSQQISPSQEKIKRIFLQEELVHEGYLLAKKEHKYEAAIEKFKEAMESEYLNEEGDKSRGIHGLLLVHKMQGKYEEALKDLEWYMNRNPQKHPGDDPGWLDEKLELEALIAYQKTGDPKLVYEHIEHLKKDSFRQVKDPKLRENMIYMDKGPKIIRLYDTIGDHDGGIRFIDEIFAYSERAFGKREVSEDNEFYQLRRVFERDKAAGTHGTPTMLIIESDNLTF